jgi:hypothetical protein
VSAGQEHFFQSSNLGTCLVERGLSIQALRREIEDPRSTKPASLLAVFLQGVSWSWTEDHPPGYGKEHLLGARALLEHMLLDKEKRDDPLVRFLLGWYLYWDMASAFIADPYDLPPLDTELLLNAIHDARDSFHPMIGFCVELFYLIACVGRHCRLVIDTRVGDPVLEASFEEQLLAWWSNHEDRALDNMSIAYRNHALIMLYQICGKPGRPTSPTESQESQESQESHQPGVHGHMLQDSGSCAQALAMDSLQRLFDTPVDSPCVNFHSIPLLTAATELRQEQTKERSAVTYRFRAIYSTNRVAVNMWAIELLQDLWNLHDCGIDISWLELLKTKGWTLSFA